MQTTHDQQLSDLLDQALDLEPEVRRRFLEDNCGGDQELFNEALECLGTDAPDIEVAVVDVNEISDFSGRAVGSYRIVKPLGKGDMGDVYLAAQDDPYLPDVAFKVIKVDMDAGDVMTRFESERQALALMDHPNIAKVLDAGTTDDGHPWFAVELVEGVHLTDYCRDHDLGLMGRLELFIEICRAVHHAHQKGLIHRDLKPSNILVTEVDGEPVPMIVDFGVAKATGQHPAESSEGRLIGTPEYMSPEQADPATQDIDTRSDVYGLGVTLYQLLTGHMPIARKDILRVRVERMGLYLKRTMPPVPSARLDNLEIETWSEEPRADTEPRGWIRNLQGDLDWITMQALAKARKDRYGSAEELADDLVRYLEHYPVLAAPASRSYRMRKYARRNKSQVMLAGVAVAALILGAIGMTISTVRAQKARAEAQVAANQAQASTLFQVSKSMNSPALALPYILGAIERNDQFAYRLQAKRLMLQGPPMWRLPVAPDSVNPYSIGISPNGTWMAVGWSGNGALQLYDMAGGEPRILTGHGGRVHTVTFSQDNRMLATAASDSTLRLWFLHGASLLRQWKFKGGVEPYFDFVRGRLITSLAVEGEPLRWQAWPLAGGPPVELGKSAVLDNPIDWTLKVDLDPSRRWLVQSVGDRLDLYDMEDLAAGVVRTIGRHDSEISGVAVSTDRRTIVSFDAGGGVSLWDLTAPTDEAVRTLEANPGPVFAGFDASGRTMAVSGYDGVKIWDLHRTSAAQPKVLNSSGRMFAAAFHPGGDWIVTTGNRGMVGAWPQGGQKPFTLDLQDTDQTAMGFSPDGRHLVLGSAEGTVRSVPLDGFLIGEPKVLRKVAGHRFGSVQFDDASRYAFLSTCDTPEGPGNILRVRLDGSGVRLFKGMACEFVVDGKGRYLAASANPELDKSFVRILDTRTGALRVLDEKSGGFTRAVGWTRDGWLVVMGPKGVGLFDQFLGEYIKVAGGMTDAWLAADRQTVFMIASDKVLWKQDLSGGGKERLPLKFQSGNLAYFAADSTLSYVIGSVLNGPAQILDMSGRLSYLYPLFESEGPVVAVDPKGRWFAMTAETGNGVVKLVSRPRGKPLENMPTAAVLAQLRRMTNLRAHEDATGEFGYRVDGEGIVDWGNPPRW